MKLNKRLTAVANMVSDNTNVIDVGCDHALLSIYLYLNKKNIRVVASDINEGPLETAKANISKYNLEDKIEVRLGNGIDPIDDKIDTIIISGMGGCNIVGILKYKTNLLKNISTIILSPNNDLPFVRQEITKLGYFIQDEDLIKEKDIIYQIIKFKKGKVKYRKKEYYYGPILIKKNNPLFKEYINKEKERLEKVIKIMPKKYYLKKYKLIKGLKLIKKI